MKKVGRNEKSHQKVKTNMYVEIGIKHEKEKFRARASIHDALLVPIVICIALVVVAEKVCT